MTSEEMRALLGDLSDTELEAVMAIATTILAGRRLGRASREVIDLDERRRERERP